MKKLLLLSLLIPIFCFGQKQNKIDTIKNWFDTEYFKIDDSNIVVSKVINDVQGTKDEIYIRVKNFFTRNYMVANCVIQTDDKEAGTIIGKGFYENLYFGFYWFDLVTINSFHILRVDIKDNRIRVICSANEMDYVKENNKYGRSTGSYTIVDHPPLTDKRNKNDAIISISKGARTDAFINLVIRMHTTIDNLEKTIKEGAISGENDNW